MENHHFQWENPLFQWPCSIAFCMFTRPGNMDHIRTQQIPDDPMPWKSWFPIRVTLVGGFSPTEKYESQWEGLSQILWKVIIHSCSKAQKPVFLKLPVTRSSVLKPHIHPLTWEGDIQPTFGPWSASQVFFCSMTSQSKTNLKALAIVDGVVLPALRPAQLNHGSWCRGWKILWWRDKTYSSC